MIEINYREKAKEILREQFQSKMDEKQIEYNELVVEYERKQLLNSIKKSLDLHASPLDLTEFGYDGFESDINDYANVKDYLQKEIDMLEYTVKNYIK